MRRNATPLLVVLLVLIIALGGFFVMFGGGGESDSSDDTTGTEPTDPVDDIVTPPDEPDPQPTPPPAEGDLCFYVILDDRGVTGAMCKASGPEQKSVTTTGGYAKLRLKRGFYDVTVSYGGRESSRDRVYVGSVGAHVEVVWESDVPPEMGVIEVTAKVNDNPVQAEVWVKQGTAVITDRKTSPAQFSLDPGVYTVKCRYELRGKVYKDSRDAPVKPGEVTIVTFAFYTEGHHPTTMTIIISFVGLAGLSSLIAAAARRGALGG